ncbi:MAG: AAA family ATPase [Pseudomonadota bacterium]
MRKVVVVASASGSGKTTLARSLAARLGVPFVELDALAHGPGWAERSAEELRALVSPLLELDGWVVDNAYRGKLGDLLLREADAVVWVDLPVHVWLPRLLRRTWRRLRTREELWNGNRETVRGVLLGRDALVWWALRNAPRRRRAYPVELAPYGLVRLRTRRAVERFLEESRP